MSSSGLLCFGAAWPKSGMSANVIRDNKQSGANLWGIMGHTSSDRKLGHQEDPKGPPNNGESLISLS